MYIYIYELDWISIFVEVRNNKASLGKSARYRTGGSSSGDPAGTKVEVEVSGELSSWGGQQSTGFLGDSTGAPF